MKVERVVPCVCLDHQLTVADSVYEGMPQLKVEPSGKFFTAYCPKCGRGGCVQYKSEYLALNHWNKMQMMLWQREKPQNMGWIDIMVGDSNA